MSDSPKRTTSDSLLDLLGFTGFMLVVMAIPLGLVIALAFRYEFQTDWYWATFLGAVLAVETAIVGGVFLGLAAFLERRRRNRRQPIDR